jgi:hypothetical protein
MTVTMRSRVLAGVAAIPLVTVFVMAVVTSSASAASSTVTATTPPPVSDPVLAVAGDIACTTTDPNYNGGAGVTDHCHQRATAGLLGQINPNYVLMLGDAQYNSGTYTEYTNSYAPSWGTNKSITKPTPGNHDYTSTSTTAPGYFKYFGAASHPLQPTCTSGCNGWYSFDVGSWHIVSINTNCTMISGGAGCAAGSTQETWLRGDLTSHPTACTLVFGHHPLWSSNSSASPDVAPLVQDMVAFGVDLYIAGHSHTYERFAPMTASGTPSATGVRELIVGTGGESVTGFATTAGGSQKRGNHIFGVEKLTLHAASYDLSFVNDATNGKSFSDDVPGTPCH